MGEVATLKPISILVSTPWVSRRLPVLWCPQPIWREYLIMAHTHMVPNIKSHAHIALPKTRTWSRRPWERTSESSTARSSSLRALNLRQHWCFLISYRTLIKHRMRPRQVGGLPIRKTAWNTWPKRRSRRPSRGNALSSNRRGNHISSFSLRCCLHLPITRWLMSPKWSSRSRLSAEPLTWTTQGVLTATIQIKTRCTRSPWARSPLTRAMPWSSSSNQCTSAHSLLPQAHTLRIITTRIQQCHLRALRMPPLIRMERSPIWWEVGLVQVSVKSIRALSVRRSSQLWTVETDRWLKSKWMPRLATKTLILKALWLWYHPIP